MKNKNIVEAHDNKESVVIKRELWFVTGLNLVLLLGLVGLYFWNYSTGAVDGFFDQIIKY